ncbi:hypothetical protein JHW46_23970 [Vibrio splendidus]|nr:hypothetical protein [Vibrio splendidus]
MTSRRIDAQEISRILGVDFLGKNVVINSLNLANRELNGNNLTYVGHESYLKYLNQEEVVCAIISAEHYQELGEINQSEITLFIVDNPEKEFYKLHHHLYDKTDFYNYSLTSEFSVGNNVDIHPASIIEDNVIIKNNVVIGANVTIHSGSIIGNNVVINAGAVIGEQGFQVIYDKDKPYLVKHVGGVKIHDNVSIGANSTIAKSLFDGYTEIGHSSKIDNSVSIAHNCKVGKNCVITAGVIMTGSSTLDDGVWLAPNSVVLNRVNVGKESLVGALSLVTKDIGINTKCFGVPAVVKGETVSKLTNNNK